MKSRDETIDVCKGIAMLLVIIGHLPTIFGSMIYHFHMALFFMLSGWCFKEKYIDDKWNFIIKRFKTLMLPFIAFKGIAYLICKYCPDSMIPKYIEEYHLLGTMWFLKCLFVASVISLLLIYFEKIVKPIPIKLYPLILLIVAGLLNYCRLDDFANYCYISFFYIVGFLLKVYFPSIINQLKFSYFNVLILLGGVLILLLTYGKTICNLCDNNYITYLPYALIAFIGSYLTIQLSARIAKLEFLKDFSIIIGQNTMILLLYQFPAFMLIDLLIKNGLVVMNSDFNLFIAKLTAGIFLPMLLKYIYTKILNIFKFKLLLL